MTTAGQARHFFPAFRVFIFGIEVTEDVLSVSVTHNDARAPSTAEIVLANKDSKDGIEDRYIITDKDILAMKTDVPLDVKIPDKLPALKEAAAQVAELEVNLQAAQLAQEIAQGLGGLDAAVTRLARVKDISEEEAKLEVQMSDLSQQQQGVTLSATETTVEDINRQILLKLQRAIVDPVKQKVLVTKVPEVTTIGPPTEAYGGTELASTIQDIAALRGQAQRYPYQVGDCIFHSNDPVRVFFRDPRSPGAWYHMFAGFISDWVDDVDENNTKTVTLRCEDVLRALRYARISTSPGLIDIDAVATDTDLILRTFFNDDFSGLTLPEFLFSLVFGFNAAGTLDLGRATGNILDQITGKITKRLVSPNGPPTAADINKDGVAVFSFDRSLICVLGEGGNAGPEPALSTISSLTGLETHIDSLALYQAVVDHQVRVTDLKSMALKANGVTPIAANSLRKDPVTGSTSIAEVIKSIGEHPEIYPVDGGRLIMLAPSTLGGGQNLGVLFQDFKGVELKTSFSTRLQKIYDVLEHIEFSFYASPKGDIIAEMPLHDFDPDAFGTQEVTHADLAKVLGEARAQTILDDGHTAGPFAEHYHIAKKDTVRWQRTFSDEHVRTLAVCSWHNIPGLEAGQTSDVTGNPPARRLIPSLIPQFGARMETVPPTVSITDKARAELYCQFLLNRFNGEARQVHLEAIPVLRVGPNRPLLFTERTYVASVREVTHSITWGERGDMSMPLKVNYVRGWDGSRDPKTNEPFYSYLGGFRANPQNYALLLHNQQPAESAAELTPPKKGT